MPLRLLACALLALYAAGVIALWLPVYSVNDYAGFVAGSRALLAGIDPYDASNWPSAWERVGTQRPDTSVYGYPPWIAVALLPLAPLPLLIGSLLWSAGGALLAALAIRRVARRFGWGPALPHVLLAVGTWPAILVFLQGQWGYLLFTLACSCFIDLADRRDFRAGAAWGAALLIKPQLFVVASAALAAWSIARARLGIALGAATTVIAAVALGTLAAPGWLAPWLADVATRRIARTTQQPTLGGLSADVAGPLWPFAWVIAAIALTGLVAYAVRRAPPSQRGAVAFAGALALSVATALYAWSYDQYLVLLAGSATLALAQRSGWPRARAAVLAIYVLFAPVAFALFVSAYARWHDTLAGLVPPLAIALLALAARAHGNPARTTA